MSSPPALPARPSALDSPAASSSPTPPPLPARRALSPSPPTVASSTPRTTQSSGQAPNEAQIVPEVSNQALWELLRGFDSQVVHVAVLGDDSKLPDSQPDLRDREGPGGKWKPERLRNNGERCYYKIVPAATRFLREMARLRDWSGPERNRVSVWCTAYFSAWMISQTTTLILGLLLLLILVPSSRTYVFPPLPVSSDPALSKPVNKTDEEIEDEGWEYLQGLGGVIDETIRSSSASNAPAASTATIPGSISNTFEEPLEDDSASLAEDGSEFSVIDADSDGSGGQPKTTEELKQAEKKAKKSKEKKERIEKKRRRDEKVDEVGWIVQTLLGELADSFERWANALSPSSSPFASRLLLGGNLILPILVAVAVVPPWLFAKVGSFMLGFLFFGEPLLVQLIQELNSRLPGWQVAIELRNSMLTGVPTNAQMALGLLRKHEECLKPLPRPPPKAPKRKKPDTTVGSDTATLFSESDVQSTLSVEDVALIQSDPAKLKAIKKSGKEKFSAFLKSAAKLSEETAAYAGGQKKIDWEKVSQTTLEKMNFSKEGPAGAAIMSLMPKKNVDLDTHSNSSFFARYNSKAGHILIHPKTEKQAAHLTFVPLSSSRAYLELDISSILEIKKVRMAYTTHMLVGWAIGGFQGVGGNGLRIKNKKDGQSTYLPEPKDNKGKKQEAVDGLDEEAAIVEEAGEDVVAEGNEEASHLFSAVIRRDELFVRLVSMGSQKWECV